MLRCLWLCLCICLSLSSCCQRCVATCSHQPVASGLITSCPISRANPLSVKQPLAAPSPSWLPACDNCSSRLREGESERYIDTAIIDGSDIFIIITSPATRPSPAPCPPFAYATAAAYQFVANSRFPLRIAYPTTSRSPPPPPPPPAPSPLQRRLGKTFGCGLGRCVALSLSKPAPDIGNLHAKFDIRNNCLPRPP